MSDSDQAPPPSEPFPSNASPFGEPEEKPAPRAQAKPSGASAPRRPAISPLALVLGLSAAFFVLFLVISGLVFMARGPGGDGKTGAASRLFGGGSVGVVELNGVILDSKKVLKNLERFEEEDRIKAVVLRLNSPGGSVAPSQEIYEAVRAFRKPLVVSMGSVAASGAFYIACGAKKVFANPGTLTGSIGVIMEFANLAKLYEWAKIKRYSIKTGRFKDAGAEYREMTPEERELLQRMVDNVLGQFKQAVASGRKLSMESVNAIADGRIVSGQQAKALRLVDELGTLQDAVRDAAKLAKLKGKPNVVYPERKKRRWLDLLLDDTSSEDASDSGEGSPFGRLSGGADGLGRSLLRLAGLAVPGASEGTVPDVLGPGIYWVWTGPR
jgi:protease-4